VRKAPLVNHFSAMKQNLKVIVTGATGMVGEGVMYRCLNSSLVSEVLVINRKPCGVKHPKLKEIIHSDFFNFKPIAELLKGYDACFFCLGISSLGISKDTYFKTTYTLTLHLAKILADSNPGMTFTYVSGMGTNSREKGGSHWSRVKGKTENDLKKLPFKQVYAYRPGFIKPMPEQKNAHPYYRYINWLFPIGRAFSVNAFISLAEIGDSMIAVTAHGYSGFILNGKEIAETAQLLKKV
jgi:uncharacterized protein YbjT (DUF2867 family)